MKHPALLLLLTVFLLLAVSRTLSYQHLASNMAEDDRASYNNFPIIINTWAFVNATKSGWSILKSRGTALDAIVVACRRCQDEQCDHTVGWGGSPDENGETTLDAMIMDGPSHKVGAVGALRNIKDAIGVARAVMEHSEHTFLVGDQATAFARQMGFTPTNLTSQWSSDNYQQWRANHCQPNYWRNVQPDPSTTCGPYTPLRPSNDSNDQVRANIDEHNHDTIGVVAIDASGRIAAGTSTNGMNHKIPGRVGDSPIAGSGSYVDQDVGGAAATGDGDIIMRFLCSYQAVENLRQGMSPKAAAEHALARILAKYPKAQVGIVVVEKMGHADAACINIPDGFPYSIASNRETGGSAQARRVECINPQKLGSVK